MKIVAWDLAHKFFSLIYSFLVGKIQYSVLHSLWDFSIHISDVPSDLQIAKHINIKTLIKWFGCLYLQICTNGRKKNAELENRGKMRNKNDEIIYLILHFLLNVILEAPNMIHIKDHFIDWPVLDIFITTSNTLINSLQSVVNI